MELLELKDEKTKSIIGMRINGISYSEISEKISISENSARVIDFRTENCVFIGALIFKFDLKGDGRMNRFFMGRAIGTIIIFTLLGIYLLLKYVLHLF